jgi:hypothetical protein
MFGLTVVKAERLEAAIVAIPKVNPQSFAAPPLAGAEKGRVKGYAKDRKAQLP